MLSLVCDGGASHRPRKAENMTSLVADLYSIYVQHLLLVVLPPGSSLEPTPWV